MSQTEPGQGPPDMIRKLATLAGHPSTPFHEAAAARAKLTALLARHGLTEADISDSHKTTWTLYFSLHQKDILLWVVGMLLDTYRLPVALMPLRQPKGKYHKALITSTMTDKIDIEACFSYYRKILDQDRDTLRAKAAKLRKESKELDAQSRTVTSSIGKLPGLMRFKYDLYPPQTIAECERMNAAGPSQSDPGPPIKTTAAEMRRMAKEFEKRKVARAAMTNADPWQKGEGLTTGVFALEG